MNFDFSKMNRFQAEIIEYNERIWACRQAIILLNDNITHIEDSLKSLQTLSLHTDRYQYMKGEFENLLNEAKMLRHQQKFLLRNWKILEQELTLYTA